MPPSLTAKSTDRRERGQPGRATTSGHVLGGAHARWIRHKLSLTPMAVRIAAAVAMLLVLAPLVNIIYQVVRKPTELFFFVGSALDK